MDPTGGTSYTSLGTTQLISAPYALHAKTVEIDNVEDEDADSTNEIQNLVLNGTDLSITQGDTVDLSVLQDGVIDEDADTTNELQTLILNNDTLTISHGNNVYMGNYLDNTDSQVLNLSNDSLFIQNGNGVDLSVYGIDSVNDADSDPTNELQVLQISNDTLYLSSGNFAVLPHDQVDDADADSLNEIQMLSISNDTLLLSKGGGSVKLPGENPLDTPPILLHPLLPPGSVCQPGDSFITDSVILAPGIYIVSLYGCPNQIGQVGNGFNVNFVFLSGSGDASSTFRDSRSGTCQTYFTGVVRVATQGAIALKFRSNSGATFNVINPNTELAQFFKIF